MNKKTESISQFDIDKLIDKPKMIITEGISWKKKSIQAREPAWLFLHFAVHDEDKLAIPYFNIEMKYRPAIDNTLLAKMSFTAIYKTQRIFALDVGAELIHRNPYWEDTCLKPQPIEPFVTGAHYHIHHEKYQKETGYSLAKAPDCVQNAFHFYLNEFNIRFHIQPTGEIPHPYSTEDKLL